MTPSGKSKYFKETPVPKLGYPSAVAKLKNSDIIFEESNKPFVGAVVTEHFTNKEGKYYAGHAFIIYDKFDEVNDGVTKTKYQIAEMPGTTSVTRLIDETEFARKASKYKILKVKVR